MKYVYILQSSVNKTKLYVGITDCIERRLKEHNNNPTCSYTKKYKPWNIINFIAFQNEKKAGLFEIYLKSNAGKAFLKKHLI